MKKTSLQLRNKFRKHKYITLEKTSMSHRSNLKLAHPTCRPSARRHGTTVYIYIRIANVAMCLANLRPSGHFFTTYVLSLRANFRPEITWQYFEYCLGESGTQSTNILKTNSKKSSNIGIPKSKLRSGAHNRSESNGMVRYGTVRYSVAVCTHRVVYKIYTICTICKHHTAKHAQIVRYVHM